MKLWTDPVSKPISIQQSFPDPDDGSTPVGVEFTYLEDGRRRNFRVGTHDGVLHRYEIDFNNNGNWLTDSRTISQLREWYDQREKP